MNGSLRVFVILVLAAMAVATAALAVLAATGTIAWWLAAGLLVLSVLPTTLCLRRYIAVAKSCERRLEESERGATAREHALKELIASKEKVLESVPDPLFMIDRSRRVTRANPAAEFLFGDRVASRDLPAILRSPPLLSAVDAVIGGEEVRTAEFVIPGEVELYFTCRVARLSSPAQDGTVAVVALHDLTSLKRAERMRADFVANASHELRTPLSSLVGFIETLRGPARDDRDAHERFLGIMHDQARRMAHLVEDLLSLSRIELQEHTPPTASSNLAGILDSVVASLEMQAEAKEMTISVSYEGAVDVIGHADELTQVFQNLVDNAVKYGREKTGIRVSVGPAPRNSPGARRVGKDCVAVAVHNEGEGIAREHIPRLTERFYRVDTNRSRALGGTGLGLAIVKHIVSRHRGVLDIESLAGAGVTFTVYLPRAPSDKVSLAAQ